MTPEVLCVCILRYSCSLSLQTPGGKKISFILNRIEVREGCLSQNDRKFTEIYLVRSLLYIWSTHFLYGPNKCI